MAGGGHAKPEFTVTRLLTAVDKVAAQDLKSAAGTVIGKFYIPKGWGQVLIKAIGFHYDAAGGAQTTNGQMALYKNGTIVGTNKLVTCAANHSADDVVETDMNATTDNLSAAPSYPTADSDDLLEFRVETQGAGAGNQSVWPYCLVMVDPQAS